MTWYVNYREIFIVRNFSCRFFYLYLTIRFHWQTSEGGCTQFEWPDLRSIPWSRTLRKSVYLGSALFYAMRRHSDPSVASRVASCVASRYFFNRFHRTQYFIWRIFPPVSRSSLLLLQPIWFPLSSFLIIMRLDAPKGGLLLFHVPQQSVILLLIVHF